MWLEALQLLQTMEEDLVAPNDVSYSGLGP